MPRYYCDYCDTYLTHDSPSVRKQHNAGYKHKANVRTYYQQFEEQQTQSLIDQKIKEHLSGQAAFQQVGVAFNQHLASVPALPRPRLPILPPPGMPMVAPSQAPPGAPMIPGVRPPGILPPAPGYPGMPPMLSVSMPPGAAPMPPPMPNGLPLPQNANVFGGNPGAYLPNPSSTVSAPNVGPPASLPQTSSTMSGGHVYAAPPQP